MTAADGDVIRAETPPGRPHEVLLHLPYVAYLDTQGGPVELGLDHEQIPQLLAALAGFAPVTAPPDLRQRIADAITPGHISDVDMATDAVMAVVRAELDQLRAERDEVANQHGRSLIELAHWKTVIAAELRAKRDLLRADRNRLRADIATHEAEVMRQHERALTAEAERERYRTAWRSGRRRARIERQRAQRAQELAEARKVRLHKYIDLADEEWYRMRDELWAVREDVASLRARVTELEREQSEADQ